MTGAAGFVGSNIAARLIDLGHEVVGIDCLTDYYDIRRKQRNIERNDAMRFIDEDVMDTDLNELLSGVDWVFHEAGQPGVRRSWGTDFSSYIRANIAVTQRLLEAAKDSSITRFVYASSSSVYGDARRYPTKEDDLPQPVSPYGVTKLAAEHLCTLYWKNFQVPTVSLRYFTVYGPGQRPDMAFTRFLTSAYQKSSIEVYGDGEQVRDFTFVSDVVEANLLAAVNPLAVGQVFNVAGGSHVTVNQVLGLIENIRAAGPLNIDYRAKVAGDVHRTGGDSQKITEMLGWRPTVSLEDGLKAQARWIQDLIDASIEE